MRLSPSKGLRLALPTGAQLALKSDPAIVGAGASGELSVARLRITTWAAALLVPIAAMSSGARRPENVFALFFVLGGLAISIMLLRAAKYSDDVPGFAFMSSGVDVSMISTLHVAFLVMGLPAVAANSRTTFLGYFAAIAGTCLRWDVRVCVVTGLIAIVEYLGISLASWWTWPAADAEELRRYGEFVWGMQIGRTIFLAVFTLIAAKIVLHSLQLRVRSTHDVLTGVGNRAFFEERLEEELLRSRRGGRPMSIALFDIDHFKHVNDAHGHGAGDLVLQLVARLLRESVRRTDIVARWGGEEFAIVFPETPHAEAVAKAEQVRRTLSDAVHSLPGGVELELSLSAGVASAPDDAFVADDLVRFADARLLEAKRTGRNRVVARPEASVA